MGPLPIERAAHGCGRIEGGGSGPEMALAGGRWSATVQIYNFKDRTWRFGQDLPLYLEFPVSVQTDSSFLLVGGYCFEDGTSNDYHDEIYEFDLDLEEFVLKSRMSKGARSVGAVLVSNQVTNCE